MGPGLFYRFGYGRDLELICIDTSQDSEDPEYHRFFQVPEHQQWLEDALAVADPVWRIPFSHHPLFCAGPEHGNDEEMLETVLPLFERGGVRLVLAGHEHNFQVSRGGRPHVRRLRGRRQAPRGGPRGLRRAHTTAWAAQAHLLLVEIDGDEARLTPISGLMPDGSPAPDDRAHEGQRGRAPAVRRVFLVAPPRRSGSSWPRPRSCAVATGPRGSVTNEPVFIPPLRPSHLRRRNTRASMRNDQAESHEAQA